MKVDLAQGLITLGPAALRKSVVTSHLQIGNRFKIQPSLLTRFACTFPLGGLPHSNQKITQTNQVQPLKPYLISIGFQLSLLIYFFVRCIQCHLNWLDGCIRWLQFNDLRQFPCHDGSTIYEFPGSKTQDCLNVGHIRRPPHRKKDSESADRCKRSTDQQTHRDKITLACWCGLIDVLVISQLFSPPEKTVGGSNIHACMARGRLSS